ncbi:B12-binding domain-containing radical SAM protein [Arsukibacterium sp.]|uniref:B12-binding domain-containing radical SAM protein n=1 Tax=Arsukibacterium sp. TaxID=1977258 RepID=UPI002FD8DB22
MYQKIPFFLFQRKGQSYLSISQALDKPVVISEMDLLLLALCREHKTEAVVPYFMAHPWVTALTQTPHAQAIAQRIAFYQQQKLIPYSNTQLIPHQKPAIELSDTPLPDNLAVGRNCTIGIDLNGFYSWSSRSGNYISLSLEQALLILHWQPEYSAEHFYHLKKHFFKDLDTIKKDLKLLFHAGLLITRTRFAQQEQQQMLPFRLTHSTHQDWQSLATRQAIPVYFVPHMENHFPLALGMLYSAISAAQQQGLLMQYQLVPIQYMEPNAYLQGPYQKFGPGIWLFSNYMWSADLNNRLSDYVKRHNAGNLTIHGGPSTPNYPDACKNYMDKHSSVDICVHGEGEITIVELLAQLTTDTTPPRLNVDAFKLAKVEGITYRDPLSKQSLRTADRARMSQPEAIPSPYLSGVFDQYDGRVEAAIIETNRGCPYGCTFCDWGSATNQKISKYNLERVNEEIDWIGKHHIRVMWIADANFGMFERDIGIAQTIVDTKKKYGYPKEIVVNYTKNANKKLVEIVRILTQGNIISQGIISIQTTDEHTLDVINRKNIRTDRYDELAALFKELRLPLSTDLMLGLPGITVAAFMADLQKYIDMDVTVKAYPTQLLPNSPMAAPDYIHKYQIKVDKDNYLISSISYTEQDLLKMKALFELYTLCEGYGLLRYIMRFLQWEKAIDSTVFLDKLFHIVRHQAHDYPVVNWTCRTFNLDKSIVFGWQRFYQEITQMLSTEFGINADSALNCIISLNQAVMPDDALTYPRTITLAHNVVAYFQQSAQPKQPLSHFAPCEFTVSDPNSLVSIDPNQLQYDSHQYFWELYSDIAKAQSLTNYALSQTA